MSRKSSVGDWFNLFWILNFFTMLLSVIWVNSLRSHYSYTLLFMVIWASHIWHKDRLREIGFWPEQIINERFLGLVGLTLVFGWLFWIFIGPNESLTARDITLKIVSGFGWGLIQQYALNGFVVNRLIGLFGNAEDRRIPLTAACLFSLVHVPNWFLMAVTFAGGYLCAKVFLKERNLYFLGSAHNFSEFLLLNFLPESLTHGFRIGQAYFR